MIIHLFIQMSCLRSYFTVPTLNFRLFSVIASPRLTFQFFDGYVNIFNKFLPHFNSTDEQFGFPRNFIKWRILVRYRFIYHYHFDFFLLSLSAVEKLNDQLLQSLTWMPRYPIRHWKEKSRLKRFLYHELFFSIYTISKWSFSRRTRSQKDRTYTNI